MNIKLRLDKLEKANQEGYKTPILCMTNTFMNEMSIGNPINFNGTIEECNNLISKKNLSVINIINDVPRPDFDIREWCL